MPVVSDSLGANVSRPGWGSANRIIFPLQRGTGTLGSPLSR